MNMTGNDCQFTGLVPWNRMNDSSVHSLMKMYTVRREAWNRLTYQSPRGAEDGPATARSFRVSPTAFCTSAVHFRFSYDGRPPADIAKRWGNGAQRAPNVERPLAASARR